MKKSIFTSSVLAMIMLLLLSTFILALNVGEPVRFGASLIWTLFLTFLTFMIYKTGNVSTYRSVFFIIYAFSFILNFVTTLIEERGSMVLTADIIAEKNVPLCPVAIPTLILPAIFKQVVIFPTTLFDGPYGGFYPILFMWLLSVVVLGRGWCSWGCFYGGIDEGFSKIGRRPLFTPHKMDPKWRYLSFAVLVTVVFWAFLEMEPVYCEWLCPLKLVTEYSEINSLVTYLQAIIFITLGMSLLIILPLLLKKRTHCGLFCPLGAFQSVVGLINPYRVKIDKDKCTECGKCKKECLLFVITDESIRNKTIPITCSRCGNCMDACPTKAINYSLAGVPFTTDDRILSKKALLIKSLFTRKIVLMIFRFIEELFDARTIYVFSGMLFGAIISGGMVTNALCRVYHLITIGSLLIK